MGLYDDDDTNVARVGGGWLAASQQANKFKIQQQKREQEIRQQKMKQEQSRQQSQQSKSQMSKSPGPNMFMPPRMSQQKNLMTPPNMMRPSNINRSKVPVPSYKAIQAANRAAAEQVDAKNSEKRDTIDRFPDEYDPLKPNDFNKFLKRRREGKHKISKYAHFKKTSEGSKIDSQGNDSSSSDEEIDHRRKAAGMGKAMVAPPTNLYGDSNPMPNMPAAKKPSVGTLGAKLGMTGPLGKRGPPGGSLFGGLGKKDNEPKELSVAEKIMAKYGHKEGAGLGKSGQGMATPLEVERTSRRGGKIIAGKPSNTGYSNFQSGGTTQTPSTPTPPPPVNIRKLPNLSKPTKIVCLKNMVSRDEIDEELPGEVTGECSKYGQVVRVQICEIPNVSPEEEVRIFLEFSRMEEAMKAVIGLHNRFFSGRNLSASFYDLDLYQEGELTKPTNG